jgi:type 1 glutamine amidotransferase
MRSQMCVRLLGAAVVVTAAALSVDWHAQAAPPAPQASAAAGSRINALVVNGGCCHNYGLQAQALMDAINRALPVDWTVAYQGGRGTRGAWPIYANPRWAAGFDLVVHNECSADVADEALVRTITQAHRPGPPALVIHCAMHTFRAAAFDHWREFLGVTSRRHTAPHNIKVQVAEGVPSQFAGFKPDWTTPVDELYVIDKFWPGARTIASAVSPEDQKEYPLAWTHDYNGTRIFGTTLGHGNDTWNDPVFQDLMVRAFKWALNRAP